MKDLRHFMLILFIGFEFFFLLVSSVRAQTARVGYALSFDGIDDYVEIKDNDLLSGGPGKSITIEAWIYPRKLEGSIPIVMKEFDTEWKDWGLNISLGRLSICIESNGDNWTYKAGNILQNVWTHVAFTFDNPTDTVRLFINGIEAGTGASLLKDMPDTEVPVWIGKNYYRVDAMDGFIDEVRIWNHARTQAQIQATVKVNLKGTEPGLIGYWRFDEGSDQVVGDSSGNGNHGQLGSSNNIDTNDPRWVVSTAPLIGSITVVSPNGGENWPIWSTQNIRWITSGPIREVKIEYSIDNGFLWNEVIDSTKNDSSFSWIIPNNPSANCLVRISNASNGEPFDNSDSSFQICAPTLKTMLGVGSSGWNMVSLPLSPEYPAPDAVFGDDVTPLNIWTYNPDNDELVYPDSIELGKGYWIMVFEDTEVDVTGLLAPNDEPYILHLVPKKSGWLLIGNPFSTEIKLTNIRIGYDQQIATLEQAHAMEWVYKDLFEWHKKSVEGDYDQYKIVSLPNDRLHPWQSYWLLVLRECDLLLYPFEPLTLNSGDFLVTERFTNSMERWKVQFIAHAEQMADTENYLGVSNTAQDTYDVADLPELPVPPYSISLFFPHEDWQQNSTRYAQDIRTPIDSDKSKTWDIEIVNSFSSGEITLTWQGVTNVPEEYEFQLVDKDHPGMLYDMRQTRQIQYTSPKESMVRHFQVAVRRSTSGVTSKKPDLAEAYALFQNFPNPFNEETAINYDLPISSKVIIEIYNLSGKRVKTLIDEDKPSGKHTVYWNGRDEQGCAATSGIYLYQLKVNNFVSAKKLVLLK